MSQLFSSLWQNSYCQWTPNLNLVLVWNEKQRHTVGTQCQKWPTEQHQGSEQPCLVFSLGPLSCLSCGGGHLVPVLRRQALRRLGQASSKARSRISDDFCCGCAGNQQGPKLNCARLISLTPRMTTVKASVFPFVFFGIVTWYVGSWLPNQGSKQQPLHWKYRVLTTGPLREVLVNLSLELSCWNAYSAIEDWHWQYQNDKLWDICSMMGSGLDALLTLPCWMLLTPPFEIYTNISQVCCWEIGGSQRVNDSLKVWQLVGDGAGIGT